MQRLIPALVLLAALPVASAERVRAHKCVGADGRLSYQQTPCPSGQQAQVLEVEGEIDPARVAEAQALAAANAPRQADTATSPTAPAPPAPAPATAKPKLSCPATQEKPGRAPALGTDPVAMAINRDWYSRLPSRTTLKNAGRWPQGCD